MSMNDRRLIEDYLPLDDLNAISAKEKKHPKHPVALVHYWPARRPTTVSRAAIYAALVSGPRSGDERAEAAAFVRRLAAFKPDPAIVAEAGDRIRKAHGGRTPKVLDLFAGGGAIPLEAARLGCESHALDYNPVAHLIELCTLVYPQTFGPKLADDFEHWSGVVIERMRADVGDLYPAVEVPATEDVAKQAELFGGVGERPSPSGLVDPVACIRVRTVPCRRPGCTAPVPLVRQAWLRKKGGVVAAVPEIEDGDRLGWRIVSGATARDVSGQEEQTGAGQAVCVACHTPAPADHVKDMVVDGQRSKLYEPISKLPEQYQQRSKLNKPKVVLRVELPSDRHSTLPLQPRKKAFDLPTPRHAPKRTAVPGPGACPIATMRGNHFHSLGLQPLIQAVAVVSLVPDQTIRLRFDQIKIETQLHQPYFMMIRRVGADRQRQTLAIHNRHDFHAFSALRQPDARAAALRGSKHRVNETLRMFKCTLLAKRVGDIHQNAAQHLLTTPRLKPAMHRLVVGVTLRKHAPRRTGIQNPKHSVQHRTGRDRLAAAPARDRSLFRKVFSDPFPLSVSQLRHDNDYTSNSNNEPISR